MITPSLSMRGAVRRRLGHRPTGACKGQVATGIDAAPESLPFRGAKHFHTASSNGAAV